jgi:hypothetical protein
MTTEPDARSFRDPPQHLDRLQAVRAKPAMSSAASAAASVGAVHGRAVLWWPSAAMTNTAPLKAPSAGSQS